MPHTHTIKVGGNPQMFMQQGGMQMNAVRPNMGGMGGGMNTGGGGMPMGNFGQGPNVLPGPLAYLEKTTSNIGNNNLIKFNYIFTKNIEISYRCFPFLLYECIT